MQKEDIMVLSHLLTAIKDAIKKLEEAEKNKDNGSLMAAKKEIMRLQAQIKSII